MSASRPCSSAHPASSSFLRTTFSKWSKLAAQYTETSIILGSTIENMGATIAISVTAQHEDFGDFITGLYVWAASSSDAVGRKLGSTNPQARDVISGFPVLWWKLGKNGEASVDERLVEAMGRMQSIAIDAVNFDPATGLPMTIAPIQNATFRVAGGEIQLISHERNLGIFTGARFPINSRLAWFLILCGTISVIIETPTMTTVATFTIDGHLPRQVVHYGTLEMQAFDQVVDRSEDWAPAGIGNISLLAGMDHQPDHHTYTYWAYPSDQNLPNKLKYTGLCVSCGAKANTREHCVPKWVVDDHNVEAVITSLFCADCNNHFGNTLEAPLAEQVRSGTFSGSLQSELFSAWAIKTALTLSIACDVQVQKEWMPSLRGGVIPDGFQVFAIDEISATPGYQFSVTHFSRATQRDGLFLLTFAMNKLLFVVLRNPYLIELPGVPRVRPRPSGTNATGTIDAVKLHDYLIEVMTGHEIVREDWVMP